MIAKVISRATVYAAGPGRASSPPIAATRASAVIARPTSQWRRRRANQSPTTA